MNENSTMTPEQSLRLINETINANCKVIAKKSGSFFILWGGLQALFASIILYLWSKTGSPSWNFLWLVMPVAGFPLAAFFDKLTGKIPNTFMNKTVGGLWLAFCVFSVSLFIFSIFISPLNISLVIILLFGFCLTSTGIVLRNWPIILAGAISGTTGAINASALSSDCHQMIIFIVAGAILVLTGLYIKYIKK